uniref:Uncharacterized protein n=1 Tax=Rhizophora mucronata TaxID=61149 RepID=A0A2P2Q5A6_RHIMU
MLSPVLAVSGFSRISLLEASTFFSSF